VLAQDDSAAETYQGDRFCPNRKGVYPKPIYPQAEPEYDSKDARARVQGTVILSAIVTKEGKTTEIKIVKSLTPGLDKQAIKTVSKWRFQPEINEDGQPCPAKINVEVAFKLY
jgi:TonB family protein